MIPIVFITDEGFLMQTGVAITSLYNSKNKDTQYDVYVVAAQCSDDAKAKLRSMAKDDMKINIVEASLNQFDGIKQCAHIPVACLLKFSICDMIPQYDKLLYLDGDIYVRGDLSEFYEYDVENYYAAGVPSLEMLNADRPMINAGIMLFNAKKMRDEHMSDILIEERRKLGDRGSMDQQTFNLLLGDKFLFVPPKYNCITNSFYGLGRNIYKIKELNDLYGTKYENHNEIIKDAVIVHFASGMKPWKFSFIPYAKEWYDTYLSSIYNDVPVKRKNLVQARVSGAVNQLKKNGIKGFIKRLGNFVKSAVGKRDDINWG